MTCSIHLRLDSSASVGLDLVLSEALSGSEAARLAATRGRESTSQMPANR